jgi:hypothetical protein
MTKASGFQEFFVLQNVADDTGASGVGPDSKFSDQLLLVVLV